MGCQPQRITRGLLYGLLALLSTACPGSVAEPQISEQQAIDVARRQVLFEPEDVAAEMDAEADPPVWRVTLRGRLPGGSLFAFEEATVTVHAVSGDVTGIE